MPAIDDSSVKASTIQYIEDDLERMSHASQMYKGFKSNKLKNRLAKQPSHTFGVSSLPSDNMDKILTHGFEKEFNERIEKRLDYEKQVQMAVIERRQQKSGHTKASLIRAEF